jgi:addiction module RelE/StbE family toxin
LTIFSGKLKHELPGSHSSRSCKKLRAKNPVQYEQLKKKVRVIVKNPESGKPLHPPLKGFWRVHIGHFVLIYQIDTKKNVVLLLKLVHHDETYRQ